jgi:hypothetical protein
MQRVQLERPHLYPPFLIDGEPPHPPLCVSMIAARYRMLITFHRKFCIAISGYKPGGDICEQIFSPSYSTPTLHVLGKTDVVVVEERSRQLIEVSSGRRVEEHVGGQSIYQMLCVNVTDMNRRSFRPLQREVEEIPMRVHEKLGS